MIRILSILYLLLLCSTVCANKDKEYTERFFEYLYNYKFRSADSVFKLMKSTTSDGKLLSLLHVSFLWHKVMSGYDDVESVKHCLRITEQAIKEQLTTYNSNSSNCNYYLILLYGYKARLSNMLGNELIGMKAFFDGIKFLEKIDTCTAETKEIYNLTGGIYYCLIGNAYKSHPYLFVFNDYSCYANKQKGYNLLIKGSGSDTYYIQVECLYFLVKLYSEIEQNNNSASYYLDKLIEQAPGNLLFIYYRCQLLQKQGKSAEASKEIEELRNIANKNDELTTIQKEHFLKIASNKN